MTSLITQSGKPPFTMSCWGCGEEWEPKPVTRGPTKGEHTEGSFDKSAADHWKRCQGSEK